MEVGTWYRYRAADDRMAVIVVGVERVVTDDYAYVYQAMVLLPTDCDVRPFRRLGVFCTRESARAALQLHLLRKGWRKR